MMQPQIKLTQGDLIQQPVEALVNATNRNLSGKGGVASAIRKAAGKALEKHCLQLIPLNVGEAKITPAYDLSVSWIIHTHGPLWIKNISGQQEENLLRSCYRQSLDLVKQYNIKTVAFPCIATGVHGFPIDKSSQIAVTEVLSFLRQNLWLEKVIFVCWKKEEYKQYQQVLKQYLM
ncbi:MAG: macro domain-containing protein [Microcystaceae cyanobacterium]